MTARTFAELEAGLDEIRRAPSDHGSVRLIVRRLYVDLDIGMENLPAGTRLAVGTAILEVSAKPHTGCAKFSGRFGIDALRFVSAPEGRDLRLRGLNASVVQSGSVHLGDRIGKA